MENYKPLPKYMENLTNIKFATARQYQWLYENKCQHRHKYTVHFGCFLKNYNIKEKIGFLDIETSNLKANFGIVLCWCILDEKGHIYEDWLTKKDILSGNEDKRVVGTCINTMLKFNRVVTHYGCLTPGHRVLTSDLKWVDVSLLKTGDMLLAFDENREHHKQRKFVESEVLQNVPVLEECYEITLDDGTTLTVTKNHPFLKHDGIGAGAGHYEWRTAEQLANTLNSKMHNHGISFNRILPVWDSPQTNEKLRFLGQIRPNHLLSQFNIHKLGTLRTQYPKPTKIIAIKDVGKKMVCGLGTTSSTYFSEGFASHNTYFDIPFLRTRALIHRLKFPEYGALWHTDAWKMAKSKLCLHSNRQGCVAEALQGKTIKTRIDHPSWRKATFGDKKAMAEVVDHCEKDVPDLKKNFYSLLPHYRLVRSSI